MKRSRVSWSNYVDRVEGPCAVCSKEVVFVIPSDRPDPALLYHSTCDMMPLIREQLKKATPAVLPKEYTANKPPRPAPAPAAVPATPATPALPTGQAGTPPPAAS